MDINNNINKSKAEKWEELEDLDRRILLVKSLFPDRQANGLTYSAVEEFPPGPECLTWEEVDALVHHELAKDSEKTVHAETCALCRCKVLEHRRTLVLDELGLLPKEKWVAVEMEEEVEESVPSPQPTIFDTFLDLLERGKSVVQAVAETLLPPSGFGVPQFAGEGAAFRRAAQPSDAVPVVECRAGEATPTMTIPLPETANYYSALLFREGTGDCILVKDSEPARPFPEKPELLFPFHFNLGKDYTGKAMLILIASAEKWPTPEKDWLISLDQALNIFAPENLKEGDAVSCIQLEISNAKD